jgi:hypothetical protein
VSDVANAIIDDLVANGFVPGERVLQIIAKHVAPVEQRLAAAEARCEELAETNANNIGNYQMRLEEHYSASCPPGQHCCLCAEDALEQRLATAVTLLREAVADPRCCCGCEWIARAKEAIG